MGIVDETLKVLDRIPVWKRLQNVPSELDDLQRRVAELEEKLNGRWPPDVCKYCGARAVRLAQTYGPDSRGKLTQSWRCGECTRQEDRMV